MPSRGSRVRVAPKEVGPADPNDDAPVPASSKRPTPAQQRRQNIGVGSQGLRVVKKRPKKPQQTKVVMKMNEHTGEEEEHHMPVEVKMTLRWIGFFLAVVIYFSVGVAFYHGHEGWDVIDAFYFAVTIITTVGYGDNPTLKENCVTTETPSCNATSSSSGSGSGSGSTCEPDNTAMVFTAFYVLTGVGIVATVASAVIVKILEYQAELAKIAQAEVLEAMLSDDEFAEKNLKERKAEAKKLKAKMNKVFGNIRMVLSVLGILFIYGMGFLVVAVEEDMTFVQAFYFICVTSTTVGFGDHSFQSTTGKGFACVWLLTVTFTTAALFSQMSAYILGHDKLDDMLDDDLTANMIKDLDADGDGKVTREEWISAMLVRLDYVDAETIETISNRFDVLDADGSGALSATDLLKTTGGQAGRGAGEEAV